MARFPFILIAMAVAALLLPAAPGEETTAGPDSLAQGALPRALAIQEARVALLQRIQPAYVRLSGGSGVVVSPDGLILTNHHVVGAEKEFDVLLPGGRTYKARVLGIDPTGDIALLRMQLPADTTVPFCPLADSDQAQVGEEVVAMGNPFGYAWDATPTVSWGVLSAIHRNQGGYSDALQTDAAINPGNSGGPLLNLQGEVLGINGRVDTRFSGRWNTGIGYAIPANQIKHFLPRLEEADGGLVHHGELVGITLEREHTGGLGTRVRSVSPGSPAATAGLREGDIISAIDGARTPTFMRVRGVIGTYPAGSTVNLTVLRGRRELELPVALTRRNPEDEAPEVGTPVLGIKVDLEDQDPGVLVDDVLEGYGAKLAGLRAGDRILKVEDASIRGLGDLQAALRGFRAPEGYDGETPVTLGAVKVTFRRQGEDEEQELQIEVRTYTEAGGQEP